MAVLYIVGNGLDLHYGLKTAPQDFRNILKTKRVYSEIDNAYDILQSYCVDWSEYEESLSNIDLEEIEFQNLVMPDYLSDHESDRDGGILNMQMYLDSLNWAIQSSLIDMVEAANTEARRRAFAGERHTLLNQDGAVLSFNYTSTLEYMFSFAKPTPICHIHGFHEAGEPLVFGYDNAKGNYENKLKSTFEDGDYYVDRQREAIFNFYQDWQKSIQVERLNSFLGNCRAINAVVVYGHSMGKVDADYMEQVDQILHPAIWKISYHTSNDIVLTNAQWYSFAPKIQFFKW